MVRFYYGIFNATIDNGIFEMGAVLTFRLLYMATMYTLNKDVKLSQFRINEKFPDRLRSARQQYQNSTFLDFLFRHGYHF